MEFSECLQISLQNITFLSKRLRSLDVRPEIIELTKLLRQSECRLLTLVGAGGMGKTRLAIEVANRIYQEFDDGVCFVPLASVRDVDAVPSAIIDALPDLIPSASNQQQQFTQCITSSTFAFDSG